MDKSTDKLRDHGCDKGGGVKKFEIFMDVIDGSPLTPAECSSEAALLTTRGSRSINKLVFVAQLQLVQGDPSPGEPGLG